MSSMESMLIYGIDHFYGYNSGFADATSATLSCQPPSILQDGLIRLVSVRIPHLKARTGGLKRAFINISLSTHCLLIRLNVILQLYDCVILLFIMANISSLLLNFFLPKFISSVPWILSSPRKRVTIPCFIYYVIIFLIPSGLSTLIMNVYDTNCIWRVIVVREAKDKLACLKNSK